MAPTTFIIKISLGNEGMRTGYDIAHAIRDVAYLMQDRGDCEEIRKASGNIKDINGNTVGSWRIE